MKKIDYEKYSKPFQEVLMELRSNYKGKDSPLQLIYEYDTYIRDVYHIHTVNVCFNDKFIVKIFSDYEEKYYPLINKNKQLKVFTTSTFFRTPTEILGYIISFMNSYIMNKDLNFKKEDKIMKIDYDRYTKHSREIIQYLETFFVYGEREYNGLEVECFFDLCTMRVNKLKVYINEEFIYIIDILDEKEDESLLRVYNDRHTFYWKSTDIISDLLSTLNKLNINKNFNNSSIVRDIDIDIYKNLFKENMLLRLKNLLEEQSYCVELNCNQCLYVYSKGNHLATIMVKKTDINCIGFEYEIIFNRGYTIHTIEVNKIMQHFKENY